MLEQCGILLHMPRFGFTHVMPENLRFLRKIRELCMDNSTTYVAICEFLKLEVEYGFSMVGT